MVCMLVHLSEQSEDAQLTVAHAHVFFVCLGVVLGLPFSYWAQLSLDEGKE